MTDDLMRRVVELEQQVIALKDWQAEALELLGRVEPDDVWPTREADEWMEHRKDLERRAQC